MTSSPATTAPTPLQVVGAVFLCDDEGRSVTTRDDAHAVLACRRAPGKSAAGKWEFPGGKVEDGEAPEDALAREIGEELGLDVEVGALVDRSSTPVGTALIDLACYLVRFSVRPTSSADHDVLVWHPLAELDHLDWADPDWPAVRRLQRGTL